MAVESRFQRSKFVPKVLWVDDDEIYLQTKVAEIQQVMDDFGEEGFGLNFVLELDPVKAYELIVADSKREEPEYGLIILDESMPSMNGMEFATQMRRDKRINDIYRFIFATGDLNPSFIHQSTHHGSMMYIRKNQAAVDIYTTIWHVTLQMDHFKKMIEKNQKRFRRALAAGIIAEKENLDPNFVFERMNNAVQKNGVKELFYTLDSYVDAVIELQERSASIGKAFGCGALKG